MLKSQMNINAVFNLLTTKKTERCAIYHAGSTNAHVKF
jgi:hypothetical protein